MDRQTDKENYDSNIMHLKMSLKADASVVILMVIVAVVCQCLL